MGCQLENPGLECGGVQRGRHKGTWDGDRRTWGGYLEGGGEILQSTQTALKKHFRRTLGDVFVEVSGRGPHGLWSGLGEGCALG